MNRNRLLIQVSSLIVCCAFALSACAAPPTPAEPDHVVLGVGRIISALPLYIAEQEGFFAEQNITVEYVEIVSGQDIYAPLATGDLDVATVSLLTGLLNLMAEEPGVRGVADRGVVIPTECQSQGVLIRRELLTDGTLDSADAFRQLTISIVPSGVTTFVFDQWLADQFGGELTVDDLNLTTLPPGAFADALNNGSVDLVSTQEPNITRLLQTTDTEVLVDYAGYMDNASAAFLVYSERLLLENPDLGRRFMVAYLQGVRQYMEGKTERNLELAAEFTSLDTQLLQDACWSTMRTDGRMDYQYTLPWQEWEFAAGRLTRILAEEEFWDPSFVEYALEQLDNE